MHACSDCDDAEVHMMEIHGLLRVSKSPTWGLRLSTSSSQFRELAASTSESNVGRARTCSRFGCDDAGDAAGNAEGGGGST